MNEEFMILAEMEHDLIHGTSDIEPTGLLASESESAAVDIAIRDFQEIARRHENRHSLVDQGTVAIAEHAIEKIKEVLGIE